MSALARWWMIPAAGIAVGTWRRRAATPYDWNDRVALVAGASRGLGLAIARELVGQGARVVIAARDTERLEEAAAELRRAGGDVLAVRADIADRAQAGSLVDEAAGWHGRLDALFNVAGLIEVSPLEALGVEDFEEALDVMTLGPIACTLAALPALRRSDAGRVVNITSIGGKVPVPHLLPYAVAKHAAVGFSESLRAEMGPRGVRVTTVVPEFMRTGSHLHAQVKGAHGKEYRWFALMAQMPVLSMPADRAARRIVAAAGRGAVEMSPSWWAPIASRAHALAPGLSTRAAGLISPLLPDAGDGADGEDGGPPAERSLPGHEMGAGIGLLSRRARRAVSAFRQQPRKQEA